MIPLTFFVIIVTVAIYGLSAVPLARLLKISEPNPQGIIMVGVHRWSIQLARILNNNGIRVLMVDSNPENVVAARLNKLEAQEANILAEEILDGLNLQGIGRLFAMTANDEVNALAALHFEEIFGRSEVYQLPYKKKQQEDDQDVSRHLRGRRLFSEDMTFEKITAILNTRAAINIMAFDSKEDLEQFSDDKLIPLILIDAQNNLTIYTDDVQPKALQGMRLIYQFTE